MMGGPQKINKTSTQFSPGKLKHTNKLLVDTGTLYSQYLSTGPQILKGVDDKDSKGTIKMHNAKILPRELVGTGQKILGYNDLYHGYMYIDYDDDMLYINQNI